MWKLVRRGVAANLGRLILTLISVFLGVAFVSGSFVLADSLRSIFDQVAEDAFAGVDAQVRAVEPELNSAATAEPRFDQSIVDTISAVPEVEYAEGGVAGFEVVYSLLDDGEVNRPLGPPALTFSWGGPSPVSAFVLLEGEAPTGQQVALDQTQVNAGGYEVGEPVSMVLPTGDIEEYELSGIVDFGIGGSGGAYFLLFDLPTAQRLLDAEGLVDGVSVNAAGSTSTDDLLAAIEPVLPEDIEVVAGEVVIGEQQEGFGSFISLFGNVLFGFAIVVLFVSTFIIYNTFAILVGQRTKQLGLLRSIGASSSQIRWMVMAEALIVGIIASLLGLLGGIGVAWLLKQLLSTGGGSFPDGPLEIRPRTVIVVMVVGLGVTLASALLPAFRASRVSPLEAVRTGGRKPRSATWRFIVGGAVLAAGLVLLGVGMFTDIDGTAPRLAAIGIGAALTFLGVAALSGLFAGPVTSFLGAPLEAGFGVTGRIGRDNASRNPQRTSATSTALMIGLALITGVGVLASSLLATFDDLLDEALTADVFVFEANQGLPFSPVVLEELDALDETTATAALARVEMRIDGDVESVAGFDTDTGTAVVNYGIVEGSATLSEGGIAVLAERAEERGYGLGDTLPVEFEDGFTTDLTIESLYDDNSIVENAFLIDRGLSVQHVQVNQIGFVGVTYADGVDAEEARTAVDEVLTDFPQLTSQDNTEFQEEVSGQIASIQRIILALLVLCLIVAFFGIVNTMALSVLERIREIGLLRAVGMTRHQLRSAIRWEAIIVAGFGSVLGVGMGLLLGWAGVVAIPDSFVSKLGIPWLSIAGYLFAGIVLGVIAAYFPARRAAKLNVLDAIATE